MSDIRVPDLNIVLIAGRLVREPEVRSTPTGRSVARFTLAHNRRYRTKDGEPKDEATYVSVIAWDNQADYVQKYLRKGGPVLVEGRLRQDEWDDPASGQRRSRLEIVARSIKPLDWGTGSYGNSGVDDIPPDDAPNMNHYSNQGKRYSTPGPEPNAPIDNYPPPEDDIPF